MSKKKLSTDEYIAKETMRTTNDIMRQQSRLDDESQWDEYASGCDEPNEECEVIDKQFPLDAFYAAKSHMQNAAEEHDTVMNAIAALIADTPSCYDKGSFIMLQAEDMSVDADLQASENGVTDLPMSFCGTYEKFDEQEVHVAIKRKVKVTSNSLVFIVK